MNHRIHIIESYNIASYNKSIALLYRQIPGLKMMNFTERVASISAFFLGRPYVLSATGEGHEGRFDQAPLYRLDSFDCVTYVNTVLALALSQDVTSFRKNLIRISYCDGRLGYGYRHHFVSVDWNIHNHAIGLVRDITTKISSNFDRSAIQIANSLIDRPGWFRHRSWCDIRLLRDLPHQEACLLLQELHDIAKTVQPQQSQLHYLPIEILFDKNAHPIMSLFQEIPHGSVIEIVRPNWNLKQKIGTNINISHMGFAIWRGNKLYYRQASAIEKRVVDFPLTEYLQYRLVSPTVKGINIQNLEAHNKVAGSF